MGAEAVSWRRVAAAAGLTGKGDLPFLLWPLIWSAWLASHGQPDPWRLAALLLAVLLGRSAAWAGFLPEVSRLGDVWRERRFLIFFFLAGALCFALPLGWAGWLLPAALALAAFWYQVRHRSYLSDPLLALALTLPPLAAFFVQGGGVTKSGGLLLLAVMLWTVSALVINPVQRGSASLAALMEPHARCGAAALRLAALISLWLAGRQAHLGLYVMLGLAAALALDGARWFLGERMRHIHNWGWETAWGGAVFVGLAAWFAWGVGPESVS